MSHPMLIFRRRVEQGGSNMRGQRFWTVLIAAVLLLSLAAACGEDSGAGESTTFSSVAVGDATTTPRPSNATTVPAAFAATAATPTPTRTSGTAGCSDSSAFVADITVPDNTVMVRDEPFTKSWRIRNDGSCTWGAGYRLAHLGDARMGAPTSVPLGGRVPPGAEVDVSVTFTAPSDAGVYRSTWQMRAPDGTFFGTRPFVQIVVEAPTPTSEALASLKDEIYVSGGELFINLVCPAPPGSGPRIIWSDRLEAFCLYGFPTENDIALRVTGPGGQVLASSVFRVEVIGAPSPPRLPIRPTLPTIGREPLLQATPQFRLRQPLLQVTPRAGIARPALPRPGIIVTPRIRPGQLPPAILPTLPVIVQPTFIAPRPPIPVAPTPSTDTLVLRARPQVGERPVVGAHSSGLGASAVVIRMWLPAGLPEGQWHAVADAAGAHAETTFSLATRGAFPRMSVLPAGDVNLFARSGLLTDCGVYAAGEPVVVRGVRLPPNARIRLGIYYPTGWNGLYITANLVGEIEVQTDGRGSFAADAAIPAAEPGRYYVIAATDAAQDRYGKGETACFRVPGRRLVHFVDGSPQPDLFEAWQASDGGRTWHFDLAPGVVLSDGRRWDAATALSLLPSANSDFFGYQSFEIVNQLTLAVTLRQADAARYYLQELASIPVDE
jgi:hypothetical protein